MVAIKFNANEVLVSIIETLLDDPEEIEQMKSVLGKISQVFLLLSAFFN